MKAMGQLYCINTAPTATLLALGSTTKAALKTGIAKTGACTKAYFNWLNAVSQCLVQSNFMFFHNILESSVAIYAYYGINLA